MDRIKQPSKEQVKKWLNQRRTRRTPLPNTEEIRRQLGWKLTDKDVAAC